MIREYNKVLTIAGSDPSGGAGIQADIKTISALGCYAASVITAVTVQNTMGVTDCFPIPASIVKAQIEAVMDDLKPEVIKIGMLCNEEIVRVVIESIKKYHPKWVVLDTVMVSTSGHRLLSEEACQIMINELIPLASIITPNIPEAKLLSENLNILSNHLIINAKAVILKGGHRKGEMLTDKFIEGEKIIEIKNKKVHTCNTHGTGCTLSSAIAAYLAKGYTMEDAVMKAEDYLHRAIIAGADIRTGNGHGPVNFFYER